MMDHLHPDELAALALDADEPGETHLDRCPRCSHEVAVLREVSRRARAVDPAESTPPPPDAVWDRVVAELTESGDLHSASRERPRRPAWQQQWAVAAGLIAVVVLAAALLLLLPSGGGEVVAQATLEPLAEVEPASATLLADETTRVLTVNLDDLPPVDGYYELWLLTPDGSGLVSLGPIDGSERYDIPATIELDAFPVIDVSREASDGDPSHSGDSVLRGPLEPVA